MSVPNHLFIVERVYATGSYNLKTHAGQAAFVDAAVIALNQFDSNWAHLKKKPGQTNIHGHGEDSALYKLPNNTAWSVDFIGGAGGPSPVLRWGPDPVAYYTHADWLDPADHDGDNDHGHQPHQPPPPVVKPYPGDAYFVEQLGAPLVSDYTAAGQSLNAGSVVWISRTIWRHVNEGMTMDQSVAQSRKEWKAALGLPPG